MSKQIPDKRVKIEYHKILGTLQTIRYYTLSQANLEFNAIRTWTDIASCGLYECNDKGDWILKDSFVRK